MSWRRLHAISDRLTPTMARRIVAAFEADRGRVPVAKLIAAIREAKLDITAVERLIAMSPELLRQASQGAIMEAVTSAAAVADQDLRGTLRLTLRFDSVNPLAIRAAQEHSATLVTNVSEASKRAIRTITSASIEAGIPARRAAQLVRLVVGLNEPQALALHNYRQRLVKAGATADQAANSAAVYAKRLLRQRAEMIVRTGLIDSLTRGQVASWERATREGILPFGAEQEWLVTPDDRLCPYCLAMSGKTAPIGGTFLTPLGPKPGPTMHPNCRCTLVLSTKSLRGRTAA